MMSQVLMPVLLSKKGFKDSITIWIHSEVNVCYIIRYMKREKKRGKYFWTIKYWDQMYLYKRLSISFYFFLEYNFEEMYNF